MIGRCAWRGQYIRMLNAGERSLKHIEAAAKTRQIKQQSQANQRHRNECYQRDRHHVCQRSVSRRSMEMEHHDRHQRQLDHDAGEQQHQHSTPGARGEAFLARGEKALDGVRSIERHNRDYGGKAHLETRADQCFGPQHQHHACCRRDHAQGQRLPPQG